MVILQLTINVLLQVYLSPALYVFLILNSSTDHQRATAVAGLYFNNTLQA
jgi:hypothetical protein